MKKNQIVRYSPTNVWLWIRENWGRWLTPEEIQEMNEKKTVLKKKAAASEADLGERLERIERIGDENYGKFYKK